MKQGGFSLLETAIVAIVIGLLIGGIVFAQQLIRQSQLKSLLTEQSQLHQAVSSFKDKYNALPGDMFNAESLWGTDPGGCPVTPYSNTRKAATCNGNGDGRIGDLNHDGGTTCCGEEIPRAWQQLANAGFIPGEYTGVQGDEVAVSGYLDVVVSENSPRSDAFPQAGVNIGYYTNSVADSPFNEPTFAGSWGHSIGFGRETRGNAAGGAFLTSQQTYWLDAKIDDGRPGTGIVVAPRNISMNTCTTTNDAATAEYYTTSDEGDECMVTFVYGEF